MCHAFENASGEILSVGAFSAKRMLVTNNLFLNFVELSQKDSGDANAQKKTRLESP